MITALIIIFSFTLGVKIMVMKKLLVLRDLFPEKQMYYDSLIKLAKMFIIPTTVLLVGALIFKIWRN
ncbi:hypothetical protein CCP3SC5AM1_230015 [Gammaproteobacteria bacterium]